MDIQEEFAADGVPLLHGSDYMLWKVKFVACLLNLDVDIFLSIEYGTQDEINEEAKKIILKGLSNHDVAKVRHYKFAKEIMDKLHSFYGK